MEHRRIDDQPQDATRASAPGLDRALEALEAARAATDPEDLALALATLETEVRSARAGLSHDRDGLTGLPTRRAFTDALDAQLAQVRRHDRAAAVVVLDLDGLAAVNDTAGRTAGDRLLTATAALIAARVRTEDAVARLGDDELGLLLVEASGEDAAAVADELRAQVAVTARDAGTPISVSAAVVPLDGEVADAGTVLLSADLTLDAAKAAGRDRTVIAQGRPAPTATRPGSDEDDDRLLIELGALAQTPTIQGALESVRELLGMEIAYVTRHTREEQIFLRLLGDGDSFGVGAGTRLPLDQTICRSVLAGDLPNRINDTDEFPSVATMPVVQSAGVRAYASVPVRLSDGQLYGTLCCADQAPSATLADRDVRFMHVLARMVAHEIERDAYLREQHELRVQAAGADALVHAVEARDAYTGEHSRLVVDLATRVAARMGLDELQVKEVAQVALLHDIGKIAVPDAVLNKPGPLDPAELAEMRRHPEHGERLVAGVLELAHLATAIRAEHERFDGTGYPDGLAGEQIPLASRITLACDAFHAMTSDRPYRGALSRANAVQELTAGAGTQFCPASVQALLAVLAGRETA